MLEKSDSASKQYRFSVPDSGGGARLDSWLAAQLPDRSRSEVQRWLRAGWVLVNRYPAKASCRLVSGDAVELTVRLSPLKAKGITPEPIPLDILYEDDHALVVNKRAGMVVHPAPGNERGTLVNAVMHHCPNIEGIGGERRPGIVHRLDKETSGVIVVAKNDRALRFLQRQFKARTVHKEYLALLEGKMTPSRGRISAPLGRHPAHRKRQAVLPTGAADSSRPSRDATTDYEVIGLYSAPTGDANTLGNFSLVRVVPLTGRTHQIRVHFAWRKHPVVGDTLYGYRRQRLAVGRLFLHAHRLRLLLPGSEQESEFEAPLPQELQGVLTQLSTE